MTKRNETYQTNEDDERPTFLDEFQSLFLWTNIVWTVN